MKRLLVGALVAAVVLVAQPAGASGIKVLARKTAVGQATVRTWTRGYHRLYLGAAVPAGSIVGTGYSIYCTNGFHTKGSLTRTSPTTYVKVVPLPVVPKCYESLSFYSPGVRATIVIAVPR